MEKTFTFLFTDIEGSTRLWEQHPQAMSAALIEHNKILTHAVEMHHGKVFKTVGDAFCTVFDAAGDAVQAAIAAQRGLSQQTGAVSQDGTRVKLHVRIGIHAGTAEERENDYFGPTLNRVARVMSAANAGQILLTTLVQQQLDGIPAIDLRDLGQHRLKDLNDPEHLYQVIVPDLPTTLTPIRSLTPRPTNLPAQLTSFVGRERDVNDICQRLRSSKVRLLTLLGPGGIGKTRLSIQTGNSLRDEYEDGVFFVNLSPLQKPEALIETIAHALKLEETGDSHLLEAVKSHLESRHLLLIMDNFEQVIDAAPLVNDLLAAAPHLKVLTTSREALMIYGEQTYPVAPLKLPETRLLNSMENLLQSPSVALFVERVQAVQPDFMLQTENAAHIVRICRRLEGLPLAIELAAVRVHEISVEDIAEQLSSRLETLSKGPRDLPTRQRTMRGAVAWSYNLLTDEEQQAFSRLGVFVGQFTVEAADAVAGAQTLNRLIEKSLVQQTIEADYPLYMMLETLREYALEQLAENGEVNTIKTKHADYYRDLLEAAEAPLMGPDSVSWYSRLENEQYNIQAALEGRLSEGDTENAGRIAGVFWRFWAAHSRLSMGSRLLEQILTEGENLPQGIRAKVAQGAGRMALLQHQYEQAVARLTTSLEMFEQVGDLSGQALNHLSLGDVAFQQGKFLEAEHHYHSGLGLYSIVDDKAGVGRSLNSLGRLATRSGNLPGAELLLQQSLDISRQYGNPESTALVLNNLAEVLRGQEKFSEAAELYRESLGLYRQLDFMIGVAVILHNLAQVSQHMGEHQQALNSFLEALGLLQTLEEKQIIAECLAGLAGVYFSMSQIERAVRLLSAAKFTLESLGVQLEYADQVEYDRTLEASRSKLDTTAWQAAWTQGQTMPLDQVIADAIKGKSAYE